ncbi:biotin operon repressor [Pyrococcus abyssi]|uniref:BirA-like biotin operon repressor/biotin--[acetyl coA carboxylase] ligase homolog n=1 Tax=Pyrococcus abyssi (strain GE5 / Orsay) TaxID=272844 RepID=Q9V2B8_PYRAB|nr:HTH domain-containing protein [Pyrococcus abyssi]CAB49080.1 birA-like biotin operon repressor/biotin--[acetyl coA carboxylase] ligase homolog [Pyrococcus abyssi GE5]CCE69532.1 TPA: related biotin operon repressor/biotin--[acetyl CoA carboxylase] ligase [Pyrococcus abyssi GE5]
MRCIAPGPKFRILEMLKAGKRVSGELIARELGISRIAVWKHVKMLKSLGYEIDARRNGYRLVKIPDEPFPWELGVNYLYCLKVRSTMDSAWRNFGTYDGVIAKEQTKGRGRSDPWISLPGGLYLSACFPRISSVSMVETLANDIAESLSERYSLNVQAVEGKLFLNGKKLGGVLIEVRGNYKAVVGVGINVRNPVPRNFARLENASLREVAEIVIKVLQRYNRRERT